MIDNCLTYFAELKEINEEKQFRQESLPQNRKFVYLGALIMSLSWLSFVQNDFIIYGNSLTAYLFVTMRLLMVGMSIGVSLLVRSSENAKVYERLVFGFWTLHLSVIFLGDMMRPGVVLLHIVVDLLALLLSYIVMPGRMRILAIPPLMFSVFSIVRVMLMYDDRAVLEWSGTIVVFVMTNVIGIIIAWQRNAGRRLRYLMVNELRDANLQLQKALDDIKTLQGIIPICANCKKIRDDQGVWNHLELYIQEHSDASFSHGICDDCSRELYGNEAWFTNLKKRREGAED